MSSTIAEDLDAVQLDDAIVDTTTDTETPLTGAPETPAEAAAIPAPPEGTPPEHGTVPTEGDVVVGGVRVDRFGRMHRADGTVMSKAEQEAAKAGTPTTPAVPAAPVVEAPKNEPFVPQVYGRPMADLFPGALKNPEGALYFPTAVAPKLEQLVARGLRYDEFRQQTAEAKQQLDAQTRRTAAEAQVLHETLLVHVANPEALARLAQRVQEVGPTIAHLELSQAIREGALRLNAEFGAARSAAAPTDATEHPTPLDPGEANETFELYWRDMLALPEYHGMPAALQQQVRKLLAGVPLFVENRQEGSWYLNEDAGADVWAMARDSMARERTLASAAQVNAANTARRPNSTAPSRIPPTAATTSPVGRGAVGHATKPVREFSDPWDAVRHADLSGD